MSDATNPPPAGPQAPSENEPIVQGSHLARLELLVVAALAAAYIAWFAWPVLWSATTDIRMLDALHCDEYDYAMLLRRALDEGTLKLRFDGYGHLHFNLALIPLTAASWFGSPSDKAIIVALRAIPAVFGLATIVLAFAFARYCFGRVAGWSAAVLQAVSCRVFLTYSVTSHPDVPQAFFFLLGLYFCCRLVEDGRGRWLFWASSAAGLTFACKYSGLFLLPVILASSVAGARRREEGERGRQAAEAARCAARLALALGLACVLLAPLAAVMSTRSGRALTAMLGCGAVLLMMWRVLRTLPAPATRLADLGMRLALLVLVFSVTFAAVSPYSLRRMGFLRGMVSELRHTTFGHWVRVRSSGLTWLRILASPDGVDVVVLGLALISLLVTVWGLYRLRWRGLLRPEAVLWTAAAMYIAYLVLRVRYRPPRYLITVVPVLVILATHPLALAARWARERLTSGRSALAVAALVAAVAAAVVPRSATRVLAYRNAQRVRIEASPAIRAGRWLARQYPASARVLTDRLTYVPASFGTVHSSWGWTLEKIRAFDPDLIIVHDYTASRYADLAMAHDVRSTAEQFRRCHAYYHGLQTGNVGYHRIRRFGQVTVYAKAVQGAGAPPP